MMSGFPKYITGKQNTKVMTILRCVVNVTVTNDVDVGRKGPIRGKYSP